VGARTLGRRRRKARFWPGLFDLKKLHAIGTVREFDEAYTAPYFGFKDAEDYYHRASSMRVIDRVSVPKLIITAEDDPFVPSRPFRDPRVTANPHIEFRLCEHGGHCGFVGPTGAGDDGYWAERQIVDFVERHANNSSATRFDHRSTAAVKTAEPEVAASAR
jgi:hypothetical protein